MPAPPPAAESARDYRIEALAKGLRVLSLFSEQRPTLRLSDVVAETGLLMPTVYRVAMTLASEGFLQQLPDGSYRPGLKVLTLGFSALAGLDLVTVATPELQHLADETGETVNLAALVEDSVLYLVRLRNANLVTANIQVGSTLPAVYTSIGKLLLAFLDEDELLRRIRPSSFRAAGPHAIASLEELRAELEKIRAAGVALQDEELAYGLRSVAAPVRGADGQVIAGMNIAVNATEWSRARIVRELSPKALRSARAVSRLLGFRG